MQPTIQNEQYAMVDASDLRTHPRNPRHGNLGSIAESVRVNGFYGALVVQKSTRYILAGNHRFLGGKQAGITAFPVLWVDVDDRAAERILLVDNRTSDLAEYDDTALAALLKELAEQGALLGTGYAGADVEALLAEVGAPPDIEVLDPAEDDETEASVELPETPESVVGEVYELGPHRLICGDATSVTDLEKLMAGATVDLLWTDPPYNVAYEGGTKQRLKIQNDAMEDGKFGEFLVEALSTASTAMRPGAAFYIAHADTNGHHFRRAVREVGWKLSQCLIWVKDAFVMGRADYHWRHEPILYGWKEGAAHHALKDRTQDTVWEFPRPRRNADHPTMKPVALIERAIRNSTHLGERVLDVFGGSGSTLIAAARAGRIAYLVELDPRYCDVIRRRWAAHCAETAAAAAPKRAA